MTSPITRLVLSEEVVAALERHLTAAGDFEDGGFLVVHRGSGAREDRLVGVRLLLPPQDGWDLKGPDQLRPGGRWLSAAISAATSVGGGLLFVHSHPRSDHPPGFSSVDRSTLTGLGDILAPMLHGPFGGVVLHQQGWAAAAVEGASLVPIPGVWASGPGLVALHPVPPTQDADADLDDRQRGALSRANDVLRSLTVGVVGVGGTGSVVAEQVYRMGVRRVVLIDHDVMDTESNLRRLFGATREDLQDPPLAKVDVVARHLRRIGLGTEVSTVAAKVQGPESLQALTDCDVIVGALDNSHSARAAMNDLAVAMLIPYVDVGARVGQDVAGQLASLAAEVRVVTATTRCLWCRGLLDPDRIRVELLPSDEVERLRREGYVAGDTDAPAPSVTALNTLSAALATCAMLGLLTSRPTPAGLVVDGLVGTTVDTGAGWPDPNCRCCRRLGRGATA